MTRGEFLLEVRAEEIPARMLPPATQELGSRLFEELMARRLPPASVLATFTPRRLVLVLEGLPGREPDRDEEMLGPPVAAAFRPDGTPTQAAEGFARRCGVEVAALARRRTEKGEYLAAVRHLPGRATPEVLAELVPRILAGLQWAKTMRWGSGTGPWVRPVHGIFALFDGQVVPISFFDVAAGDLTAGHATQSPGPIRVDGWESYRRELAARGIVVELAERRRRLVEGMRERAAAAGGELVVDEALLDKLAAICEIPGVMEGAFDPRFLALPREVLTASLRDHQSALTVERGGELLPLFLTVMDRPDDPAGRVRAGNEWVVAARLADAEFFYRKDAETPLAVRGERLRSLAFHERLGSYAAKGERLVQLAGVLAGALGWGRERASAEAAAALLKADLTTEMVKEFTDLQGMVGGIYAREQGHPEAVWQAVYDQYRPSSQEDAVPRGRAGRLAGLADRLDTLVGFFGLGLVPTGSRDPFGLRRAAQGVVRILLEGEIPLDLPAFLPRVLALYGDLLPAGAPERMATLGTFFEERIRHQLALAGFAYDEIEAGLRAGWRNLPDLRRRVEALHQGREQPGFLAVVLAAKRIANIVRGAEVPALDPERLAPGVEAELGTAIWELRAGLDGDLAAGEYGRSLRRIAELSGLLERFFVEVLVMDPDPAVRGNRLALLSGLGAELARVAVLTEMVVEKGEQRAG